MNNSPNKHYTDELDEWFCVDEKNIDIINKNITNMTDNDPLSSQIIVDESLIIEDKSICVDDIITMKPDAIPSNELIQYECLIAYFIQLLLEGSNGQKKLPQANDLEVPLDKLETIIEYLRWISSSSETLAKRIGQETINNEFDSKSNIKPSITRSSYNFCIKTTQCKNFYSKNEKPTCKDHHYVHSLLKYDIDSVINYLSYIVAKNYPIENEDVHNLNLSIKTICFVTRHMAKEISYIDYITKKNSEVYHRNNPSEMFKKKNYKKQFLEKETPERKLNLKSKKAPGFKKNQAVAFNNTNRFALLSDE